ELFERPGEPEWHFRLVVLKHGGSRVLADVEGLVERKANADRVFDPPLRRLFFINEQRGGPGLADAAALILELDADDVVSGREGLAGHASVILPGGVRVGVGELRLAALPPAGPAAVAAADRRQHAVCTARRDGDLGSDRPGFILEVGSRPLGDADHTGEIDELA